MLLTLTALLAAATLFVPLTRRGGLGAILGYLLAGLAIGPSGLRLVTDVEQIGAVSALGVIMLMFLIGLELRPRRLWVMRRPVFATGTAQVLLTAMVLAAAARLLGVSWNGAAILGLALALSSTAMVLPMLAERDLLTTPAGRDGFAVLLFQDLAFIPLVALVPLLAGRHPDTGHMAWRAVGEGLGAIAAILLGGRYLLGPLFRAIGGARSPELFTTLSLLIVIGTAFLADAAGLSPSLGAFLAGVMLSASEYRHELQANVAPFQGTLLGFFFISVGMSADLHAAWAHAGTLAVGTCVLLIVKAAVAGALALVSRRTAADSVRFGIGLAQASEFSFVLTAAAAAAGILPPGIAALCTLVSAASMLATPVLFALSERFLIPRLRREAPPEYDTIESSDAPVILAGFGRLGQIVGRVLTMAGIEYTALDRDAGQVEVIRRFGHKVWYGDASRPDLLRAAGADRANVLIVALEDVDHALLTVETAKRNHPHLRILSRARNRQHAHLLMDRDVDHIVRDTFFSALRLAELTLRTVGFTSEAAARAVHLFRQHDERNLMETHAWYHDEARRVQTMKQAADELASLFQADQRRD